MKTKSIVLLSAAWTGGVAGAFVAGLWWRAPHSDESAGSRVSIHSATDEGGAGESPLSRSAAAAAASRHAADQALLKEREAAAKLTPEQASARIKDIYAIDDPVLRMETYLAFIKGLETNDQMAAAVGSVVDNFGGRDRGRELSMLMTEWAKRDPLASVEYAAKLGDGRGRAADTALAVWAQQDPEAAIAWAKAHPNENEEEGNTHMAGVISGIAKTSLDRAALLTESMERSEARGAAMERLLDQYFRQRSGTAARDWALSLAEGDFKNNVLPRVAERMVEQDVNGTARWAAAMPDGEAKPRVMAEVIEHWADSDPNEAGRWLNSIPRSAQTDEPRERFAWEVHERDPEAAIAWAGTLTDERRRAEASYRLAREWMRREPDSARPWIANSPFPPEVKQRLLNNRRG